MSNRLLKKIGVICALIMTVSALSEACVTVNTQQETYTIDGSGSVEF